MSAQKYRAAATVPATPGTGTRVLVAALLLLSSVPGIAPAREFLEDFSDDADPTLAGFAAQIFEHQTSPFPPGTGSGFWTFVGSVDDWSLLVAGASHSVEFDLVGGEIVEQIELDVTDYAGSSTVVVTGSGGTRSVQVGPGGWTHLAFSTSDPADSGGVLGNILALRMDTHEGALDDIAIVTRFTTGADVDLHQEIVVPLRDGARGVVRWSLVNHGPETATGLVLNAPAPTGLAYVPGVSDPRCAMAGSLVCVLDDLDPAEDDSVVVAFDASAGSAGQSVTISAAVATSSTDYLPENNSANITLVIGPPPSADLALTAFSVRPEAPAQEEIVEFEFAVENRGPDTAFDVQLDLSTPPGTQVVPGAGSANCSTSATSGVECMLGDLPAQSSILPRLALQLPGEPVTCTPVTATVSAAGEDPDATNDVLARGYSSDDGSNFDYEVLARVRDFEGLLGAAPLRIGDLLVMVDDSVVALVQEGGPPPQATRSWILHGDGSGWRVLVGPDEVQSDTGEPLVFVELQGDLHDRIFALGINPGDTLPGASTQEIWVREQTVQSASSPLIRLFDIDNLGGGGCQPCLADWDVSGTGHVAIAEIGPSRLRRRYAESSGWSEIETDLFERTDASLHRVDIDPGGRVLAVGELHFPSINPFVASVRRGAALELIIGASYGAGQTVATALVGDQRVLSLHALPGGITTLNRVRFQGNGLSQRRWELVRSTGDQMIVSFSPVLLDKAVHLIKHRTAPTRSRIGIADVFLSGDVYRHPRCLFGHAVVDIRFFEGAANDRIVVSWLALMEHGEHWLMRAAPRDTDGDGVADYEERSAWLNSDGNGDGIEDHRQAEVVSTFTRHDGEAFSTNFALPAPARFRRFSRSGELPIAEYPFDARFPWRFNRFEIEDVVNGGRVEIVGRFSPPHGYRYFKFGSTLTNPQPHWYPFDDDGDTGFSMLLDAGHFRMAFRDGGRGDDDGLANGRIVDPGGLAAPGPLFTDGFEAWLSGADP